MAKKEDLKNTMAAALSGLEEKTDPAAEPVKVKTEKPKRRRKSIIEQAPLPEPKKKRTRRGKDPALKKTHPLTLLLTEQLYERFKATAEEQGYSMNGIVTRLIKKYIYKYDLDYDDTDF